MLKKMMRIFLFLVCSFRLADAFVEAAVQKKVIIIGASAGIGRELARVFVAHGFLVGGVARSEDKLIALKAELGAQFSYVVADVCTSESADQVRQLIEIMGGCDIFVMNAGIWADGRNTLDKKTLEEMDWAALLADQLKTIETNISGFVRMGSVAFEHFMKEKKGHFVGISSVDAVRGNPFAPTYSGTKSFESIFMQGWRSVFEIQQLPIFVTDIRPGFIATYSVSDGFWIEPVNVAAGEIFDAIMAQKKVAYITSRWEAFADYLISVPDKIYNFLAFNFNIK